MSDSRDGDRSPRRSGESNRAHRARNGPSAHAVRERQEHRKRKALKNHLIAAGGEFLGTTMFLWFAFAGTQVSAMVSASPSAAANGDFSAPIMDPQRLLYISLSFGMSLLVVAWAFYRISGGLFNPAVTLGLCISGAVPWLRGLCLLPAQLLGGIVAAGLVSCMIPGPISLFQTRLSPSTSIAQALLVFVILMLTGEKHKVTFIAPIGIGLALFVAELAGVFFTGGSLNPARSFGPDVVAASFPEYHYIYWFGPIIGAMMAGGYYRLIKLWNYEEVNPGQDATSEKESA